MKTYSVQAILIYWIWTIDGDTQGAGGYQEISKVETASGATGQEPVVCEPFGDRGRGFWCQRGR